MESFENIIPSEYSLNNLVMSHRDEIDEILEGTKAAVGDIIEPNSEIRHDIVTMGHFADACSQFIAETEDQQADISAAIYRSICFAEQTTCIFLPENYRCNLTAYMTESLQQHNSIDGLVADTQEYLQHRESLDSLIGYYAPEIDPTAHHHHVVELFSGMFFMLAERSISEQYIQKQIKDINPEDIINKAPPA